MPTPEFACRQGALVLALMFGLAFLASGCPPEAKSKTLPAQRIVALGPSLTEMVFALGLGDRLVGRSNWCNHPPEAQRVPAVGAVNAWNEERVMALKPDLILALEGQRAPVERLAALTRAQLVVLPTESVADIGRHMATIAQLAGVSAVGRAWAQRLEENLQVRRAEVAKIKNKPRTFYVVWDEPLMTAGPRSYIGELIELAGGQNIVPPHLPGSYPTFGFEALLVADPDVLLTSSDREGGLQLLKRRFAGLRAVHTGQVHSLPSDLISRPGPRVLEALAAMKALLQPRPPSIPLRVPPPQHRS
ncbi:MAG: helical backbone metal receptor [Candidatus Sericytochromatia bacterium]|nr:helical backbone metal receptor [Candidatus Sericytochromatia bacterium]